MFSRLLFPSLRPLAGGWSRLVRLGLGLLLLGLLVPIARGQSLRKLERGAINRTRLTFVNGDTVQRFTVTYARPAPRPGRFYYWQGPTQILRTAGAYDGRLLTGAYQLTSRNGNLLGSGTFHKGLKTGQWRTWRPDGTPVSRSSWRRGRQRGKTQYYDAAGQRLKPTAPPPAASPAAPAISPRFWQATYWRAALTRRQLRRRERQRTKAAAPAPAPAPGKQPAPKPSPKSAAPGATPAPGS